MKGYKAGEWLTAHDRLVLDEENRARMALDEHNWDRESVRRELLSIQAVVGRTNPYVDYAEAIMRVHILTVGSYLASARDYLRVHNEKARRRAAS